MEKNNSKERVLIIAPVGRDAQGMAELLVGHGFEAQICGSLAECAAHIQSGAGALILTEEALELGSLSHLFEALAAQPSWSELPLIILTTGGESRLARLLELAAEAAGSVTLLERPVRHYNIDTFSRGGVKFAPATISGARFSGRATPEAM